MIQGSKIRILTNGRIEVKSSGQFYDSGYIVWQKIDQTIIESLKDESKRFDCNRRFDFASTKDISEFERHFLNKSTLCLVNQ